MPHVVYWRRRMVAVAVVALLIALLIRAGGSDSGPPADVSPAQLLREARASEPVRFTVAASGDLLIHSPVYARALANGGGSRYEFGPMFERIRAYVMATELPLCHVETPMGPGPPASYPIFNTPAELAAAIRATGWRACDTASNHSLDQGQPGIDQTGAALDRAGIEHTGSFPSPRARKRPLIIGADGVRVAFLAYTDMTNGIPLPNPWSVNLADSPASGVRRILADARRARRAGAEAVIVNLHWGDEHSTEPNASQLELARRLTASRLITAIVGQGPHVVQPIVRMNRKFVVFSAGNLVSNQGAAAGLPAETQYGMIALLRCIADERGVRVRRVDYVPTWVRLTDYLVLPVGTGLREDPANAPGLRAAYESTVEIAGRGPRIRPIPAKLPD